MKRSRGSLAVFLTTLGLSLIAIGSTTNRSRAADVNPAAAPACQQCPQEPESCSSSPPPLDELGDCELWHDDWHPTHRGLGVSLKQQAQDAIIGLMALIDESRRAATEATIEPADGDEYSTPVQLPEVYGCEGYDLDEEWYAENAIEDEESTENSMGEFNALSAWRDLSSLVADPRHSEGLTDLEDLNAVNDGLSTSSVESAAHPGCGRPWNTLADCCEAQGEVAATSDEIVDYDNVWSDEDYARCQADFYGSAVIESSEADIPAVVAHDPISANSGLDCEDYGYCGNEAALNSERSAAISIQHGTESDWIFEPEDANPADVEVTQQDLRSAMLTTAHILEQVGAAFSGWSRNLQEAAGEVQIEITSAPDYETWGL